jgi:polysaccharide export outer membrane protein
MSIKGMITLIVCMTIFFSPPVPLAKEDTFEKNRTYTTEFGLPEYLIAPGDILEIRLWRGFEEKRYEVTVKPNGFITVTFIELKVSDRTPGQAEAELKRALADYVREPRVEVSVKEYRGRTAALFGAIRPGIYILKGKTTLTHLMINAGGLAKDADPENIQITTVGGERKSINFFQIVSDPSKEVVIDDGDSIYVPTRVETRVETKVETKVEIVEDYVFILGEVQKPGAYKLTRGFTLSQAIGMASGYRGEALIDEIRIIRSGDGKSQIITADFRAFIEKGDIGKDVSLQKNDIIFVPKTKIADWNAFLAKLRPTLEFIVLPFIGARDVGLIK